MIRKTKQLHELLAQKSFPSYHKAHSRVVPDLMCLETLINGAPGR